MKPLTKTILVCRVIHERKTRQWPVAVFSNASTAKQYAVFLHLAHNNGDADTARKLDPRTVIADDGTLVPGAKWAIQTVPYQPVPDTGVADDFAEDEPATV